MNENVNLCEILKDCPKGTKLFSYIHGEVKFCSINLSLSHPIIVKAKAKAGYIRTEIVPFSKEGIFDDGFNGICTLVPSLEQPDWSKWQCSKSKFDPKTLKPFDKVLARINKNGFWCCELFSFIEDNTNLIKCCGAYYKYCVPYNNNTKHLVGTTEEAPEYYRYWGRLRYV